METIVRLLTVEKAAEYLKSIGAAVSVKTIRALICGGSIPVVKLGRRYYLSREVLDAWLKRHERCVRV